MALKKSQLYSSLWKSCDELRGGMDASQYKDWGRRYRLDVTDCIGTPSVCLRNNRTMALHVRRGATRENREAILHRWYRQLLRDEIPKLIAKWQPLLQANVADWGIKKMKTRWGTCNKTARRIWLNLELAKKTPSCLEYVLVHEMVHLLERRHNDRFCEALSRQVEKLPPEALIVVDAIRIKPQIEAIRRAYGTRVFHIHLEANPDVLAQRYARKQKLKGFREFGSYARLSSSKTERRIGELADLADVVIQTDLCTNEDVLARAAAHVGLYGRECQRFVDVLVGGEYGSEGKGHISSYLAPEYDILVRVGGPNAGHKVFEDPQP